MLYILLYFCIFYRTALLSHRFPARLNSKQFVDFGKNSFHFELKQKAHLIIYDDI